MDTSNGQPTTSPLKAGSELTSPESERGDVLLPETLAEITELFRLEEAFPVFPEKEEEHVEEPAPRLSWWRRVANWCGRRAARNRT
jgi:hypothetical protein